MRHVVIVPAKLNLCLHITGRRPDGYHLLESLVAFTDYGDTLELLPAERLSLQITGPFSTALQTNTDDNLVMRAARLLTPYANGKGATLVLSKLLPVGAGLGGGSNDAATALKCLMAYWNITLDHETVMEMALALGSDVPVCYAGHTAWMSGIGEEITPCALHIPLWVLLVNTGTPLATADVYRAFHEPFAPVLEKPLAFADTGAFTEFLASTSNMLEPAAKSLQPVIGDVLTHLDQTSGCLMSRMSGSGATCFGLYATDDSAQQAAISMQKHYPRAWIVVTSLRTTYETQ